MSCSANSSCGMTTRVTTEPNTDELPFCVKHTTCCSGNGKLERQIFLPAMIRRRACSDCGEDLAVGQYWMCDDYSCGKRFCAQCFFAYVSEATTSRTLVVLIGAQPIGLDNMPPANVLSCALCREKCESERQIKQVQLKQPQTCPVCRDDTTSVFAYPCKHICCVSCFSKWKNTN